MNPKAIAESFSREGGSSEGSAYLAKEGLFESLDSVAKKDSKRIAPKWSDLARLHMAIRARKVFTVLEFGVGFSTVVMADALKKNRDDWERAADKPKIRSSTPFQLHSVDTSATFLERTQAMVPAHLEDVVNLHLSTATASTFDGRCCHYYESVPDVVPDFIYLDGPDPADVAGGIGGLTWHNPDRVVTSGDILRMEPQLLPGTLAIIDGRTSNARFLAANFYRCWSANRTSAGDITVFELQEAPLGSGNSQRLLYCLGQRALEWTEPLSS